MLQTPPSIPELLNRLQQFIVNIEERLSAGNLDWQHLPSPHAWSLTQLFCHLRDVELEVHQPRFQALIAQENAFISGANPDEWAEPRQYQLQDGQKAWQTFLAARHQTIEMLTPLMPQLWTRQGQHAFFGPTSMQELLYLVVLHDDAHWEQITAILNSHPFTS